MEKIAYIVINKNRGWRGLAELKCLDEDRNTVSAMVFSFSQAVWKDMLEGYIITQDANNYYIIGFDNSVKLPAPTQQRSVLIKNVETRVFGVTQYSKETWTKNADYNDYRRIVNFIHNSNRHTTSDWNYVGIRVMPTI